MYITILNNKYNIHLKVLDIGSDKLINLPAEIGKLINLEFLLLHDGQLTTLPEEIGNLINLYKL